MKSLLNLSGRRALVTGSSQGIGQAIAIALADCGADVLVHCAHNVDKAKSVCAEIEARHVRSGVVVADLGTPRAISKIETAVQKTFGQLDILVLNASVQTRKPWTEITHDEYLHQCEVNLGASLALLQRFAPPMQRNHWGRILIIGSVQQVRPHPDMLVYAASKAALANIVRNLARQLAPDGVTINTLAPGAIATARNEHVLADASSRREVLAKIPLGFVGEPRDCAGLAVLLCSEVGRYITGQDHYVDGGMSLP